ncbi:MAG: hypothetical protein B7Y12_14715, partial [Rhizobiales bacterium 24-66-13]
NKDVQLFMQEAKAMGLSLEACDVVAKLWAEAVRKLGFESDFTKIVTLIEDEAGVKVRSAS